MKSFRKQQATVQFSSSFPFRPPFPISSVLNNFLKLLLNMTSSICFLFISPALLQIICVASSKTFGLSILPKLFHAPSCPFPLFFSSTSTGSELPSWPQLSVSVHIHTIYRGRTSRTASLPIFTVYSQQATANSPTRFHLLIPLFLPLPIVSIFSFTRGVPSALFFTT